MIKIFSLKYIFPIFIVTFLVSLWYEKTNTLIIENGAIQNPSSFMMILGYTHLIVTGILLYALIAKFVGYMKGKLDVKKEIEINTSIVNTPAEVETEKIEFPRKYEKDKLVSIVASTIFVLALLYPAWIGFDTPENGPQVMYGYDILMLGWVGIIALYAPWYFMFPAVTIIRKVTAGVGGKMLLSRIMLFLFWLEGYIAVVGFKWGGASDAGDFQIMSIGPSFWMWTILVWYILICSYIYVNFPESKVEGYTKLVSVATTVVAVLLLAQYHFANLL